MSDRLYRLAMSGDEGAERELYRKLSRRYGILGAVCEFVVAGGSDHFESTCNVSDRCPIVLRVRSRTNCTVRIVVLED